MANYIRKDQAQKTTAKVEKASAKNNSSKAEKEVRKVEEVQEVKAPKRFQPGDMIPCRCVRPNKVVFYSTKTDTRYEFGGYGDINEVDYSDLQKLRSSKSPILFQPKILIEDPDLREQWARDLADVADDYDGVYNLEDLFDKTPDEFERYLRNASSGIKENIRISAAKMIHEEKLTDLRIIRIIDDVLGTKYKEFI